MKKYSSIRSKRGSIIVEAAIFLPVFLISLLTLGLLIRQAGTEETVFHAVMNQGRLAGITAYSAMQTRSEAFQGIEQSGAASPENEGKRLSSAEGSGAEEDQNGVSDVCGGGALEEAGRKGGAYGTAVGLGSRQLFTAGLRSQLEKELQLEGKQVKLSSFRYLYQADGRDQLIEATVRFGIDIPIPKAARAGITGEERLVIRAFTGRTETPGYADAKELEERKQSQIVYVFPRAGEKYHSENCITITSTPVRRILTGELRRRYKPCSLCSAQSLEKGSVVYCFEGYGEAYHRKSCGAVEKYVVAMERDEAMEQGYLPCKKCGGAWRLGPLSK